MAIKSGRKNELVFLFLDLIFDFSFGNFMLPNLKLKHTSQVGSPNWPLKLMFSGDNHSRGGGLVRQTEYIQKVKKRVREWSNGWSFGE